MRDPLVRKLRRVLLAGNCALIAAYLIHIGSGETSWLLRVLFNLDGERTIAAWYTSAQLLLAGAVLLNAAEANRQHSSNPSWFLRAIGLVFCFLSADEVVGIHEIVGVVLRRFEALPRFEGDHGVWIAVYAAAGAVFMATTAKHWSTLRKESRHGTTWLIAGALLFLAGSVGLEILSYGDLRESVNRRLYTLQVAAEEGLELFGASAMLIGAAIIASMYPSPPNEPVRRD